MNGAAIVRVFRHRIRNRPGSSPSTMRPNAARIVKVFRHRIPAKPLVSDFEVTLGNTVPMSKDPIPDPAKTPHGEPEGNNTSTERTKPLYIKPEEPPWVKAFDGVADRLWRKGEQLTFSWGMG